MKTKIKLSLLILLSTVLVSCEDYFDKQPDGDMTIKEVFSNYTFSDRFLANTYLHLPTESNAADSGPAWRNPFTAGCDEMEIAYGGSYTHLINSGAWNPSNIEDIPVWSESYMGIRKTNLFIENIDNVPPSGTYTATTRDRRKGEAYFLRALFYSHLVRCYGPVPLCKETLPTDVDYFKIKRAPLDECITSIVEDCDLAASLLPIKYSASNDAGDVGRATKAAALALKSRVLLYAASPLLNGDPMLTDFADNDGVKLFPAKNDNAWSIAAGAALDCITQLEAAGYGLYRTHRDANTAYNYEQIFLDRYNKEWIFWKNLEYYGHFDNCSYPLSLGGFSIMNPTQEMVDAYEMADGSTPITGYNADGSPIINTASGYSETGYAAAASPDQHWPAGVRNMYVDREPRFYASINFNGQKWKDTHIEFWYTGKDGRKGAGSDYCKTGYLQRKIVDPSPNIKDNTGRQLRCWVYFRMAEIYLNYAEAINEAEGPTKAYAYINDIRDRAGLKALPTGLNRDQMRDRIKHERRIELAFETHRFFDLRRWKDAEKTENKPIHSMDIYAGTSLQDNDFYKRIDVEPRIFDKTKHYLWPIPQAEINRTERVIVQNPGWTKDE